MSIDVKVKKVRDNAVIPTQGTPGAAGFDLTVAAFLDDNGNELNCEGVYLNSNHTIVIRCATGLAMEIPEGYCLKILPRSGLAFKECITVVNAPGLIDSDYRGEIVVGLIRHHSLNMAKDVYINIGDRVAQGVFEKYEKANFVESNELSNTDRGEGGFGSTGSN